MDRQILGYGNKTVQVYNECSTGVLRLTVIDSNGEEQEIQLSNGNLFELAMTLLECVEHKR